MYSRKGFMLVEALLVFALCILIVASVVSGSFDVSIMDDQIQLIEKSSADEKLRDAYGT